MEMLGGLSYLGNLINGRTEKEMLDNENERLMKTMKKSKKNHSNLYDRNIFKEVNNHYDNLATQRTNESKRPGSGIVGRNSAAKIDRSNYNEKINMSNMDNFLSTTGRMIDNRKYERQIVEKIPDNNNYVSQFDFQTANTVGDPVSSNAVHNYNGSSVARMEMERSLALDGNYSNFGENADYGIVDKEHFSHTNMQPMYRKSLNFEKHGDRSQHKIELFSGLKRDGWTNKQEQTPLFDPIVNISNIYGDVPMTDELKKRYIPGRERKNELPFKQIKVGVGVGIGNSQNADYVKGNSDVIRIMPKNVDELRAANKPKLTYEGRVVEGMHDAKGPVIGRVVKKTPDSFKENNKDDLIETFNDVQAPRVTGEIDPNRLGSDKRGVKGTVYYGVADANNKKMTTDNMRGQFKQSFKQTFKQAGPRNVQLVESLRGRSTSFDDKFIPAPTQRGKQTDHMGNVGGVDHTYAFNYEDNTPNTTIKQLNIVSGRTGVISNKVSKGQYFNPDDTPDITIRQIHGQTDRTGNIANEVSKSHYYNPSDTPNIVQRNTYRPDDIGNMTNNVSKGQFYKPDDTPDITMRQIHDRTDRTGNIVNEVSKSHYFNPSDTPDITMRQIHDRTDRTGNIVNEVGKGQFYRPDDTPNITMRQVHDRTDRTGNITNVVSRGQFYRPDDTPDITMRQIHGETDRTGNVTNGVNKGQYFNPSDTPDITMRQIHGKTDRTGNVVNEVKKGQYYRPDDVPNITQRNTYNYNEVGNIKDTNDKGYVINYMDATPATTLRELTGKKIYINPAQSDKMKDKSRMDASNMTLNTRKESKGRLPTKNDGNCGPTTSLTKYRLKDNQLPDDRMSASPAPPIQTTDKLPMKHSKNKNETYFNNVRINTHIIENLNNNPYINNVIHKAKISK